MTIYGVGELTTMLTKGKTKHIHRHTESTRKQVQGTKAQRTRASTPHTITGTGHQLRQRGSQIHKQGPLTRIQEQGTRNKARQGYVLTEGMPWKHPEMVPGQAPSFSTPLAADRAFLCHRQPTTPVESGRVWPAQQQHPNEQPGVIQQCHLAR